jgi:hypothetical protein
MNPSFRSILIDLLDDPHGIAETVYQDLINFGDSNYPGQCDDIANKTISGEGKNGLRVWIGESAAEDLRKVIS